VRHALTAPELLRALQALEQAAGRERPTATRRARWTWTCCCTAMARIASARLTVPHPRMRERAFVLLPLAELAPERVRSSDLQAVRQRIAPLPPASSPA
jgi:2-amino-4-hydroxy-6-hydroxymethyldihydropteridine diphosphokinase